MNLVELEKWRYATKAMNDQKVSQENIDYILEAIQLAPTSSGIQPLEVFIIKGEELKNKIFSLSFNQTVVKDCSHLLVFTAWDNYTEARINEAFENMFEKRGARDERWDAYRQRIVDLYTNKPAEENFVHTARQAYIAFSFAIMAAAELGLDATPMEGFDSAALDELLDFKKRGLKSVTMLPIGYRAEDDWNLNMKKVRKDKEVLFTELD
ncbi:NAD(P)H-dependent oxidoreductase [Neptunitalea chrysea]|uniref:NAD(P)H-dependent oxidoreductase n=1 Tax=Neptunitalea chrysea TaxID=1647581 RepID=A0A9W6EVP6_9FLAO|nr:nitroreductase family protein [Neptunitalea chrysea]GLB51803.1 NAD(P)H-dependent oxidoreductase [Neptunitalea chrysea]